MTDKQTLFHRTLLAMAGGQERFFFHGLYITHGIQKESVQQVRKLASERFFVSFENHTNFTDSCD